MYALKGNIPETKGQDFQTVLTMELTLLKMTSLNLYLHLNQHWCCCDWNP